MSLSGSQTTDPLGPVTTGTAARLHEHSRYLCRYSAVHLVPVGQLIQQHDSSVALLCAYPALSSSASPLHWFPVVSDHHLCAACHDDLLQALLNADTGSLAVPQDAKFCHLTLLRLTSLRQPLLRSAEHRSALRNSAGFAPSVQRSHVGGGRTFG